MKTLAIPLLQLVIGFFFFYSRIYYNWWINTPSCVAIGFVHNYHFILFFEVISFTVVK